jgi:cytoskeletal protein CcmA (bactofilin family)
MALTIADRVRETTTTTGTGTITLNGAVGNFETFTANLSDGDTTYYAIVDANNSDFEVGLGTFASSGTTLARTTVIASSNSNSAVNLSSGSKDVFITLPASKMVFQDASGNVSIGSGSLTANGGLVADNITIDGTEIDLSSGNLTIDVAGHIILDADTSGIIQFADDGTVYTAFQNNSGNVTLSVPENDEDFIIQGKDGGSVINALFFDMSEAGAATFNSTVTATGFIIGSANINENDLESIDDVTAGTISASKAAVVDTNKDITGFRNITLTGELDAGSLDVSGDADIDGTLEADAITVNGTALNTVIAGVTVTDATNSAHVLVTDNESTNEENPITFVENATTSTGNVGLEMDGDLTYNPSTGRLTATQLSGTLQTAAQANITSLGTLTTLTVDNVIINGSTIGHTGDTDLMTVASGVLTVAGEVDATSLDISGDADIDGTLEADAITVNGTALGTVIAGTTVTLASTVTVTDSTANTNFPVVFHDESNALLDDTGALRYNPSTGELLVPKLTVAGTTTTVDTVTMNAQNAIIFEGATADAHETTLTIVDPTADRTINLPNVSGTIPVLAAVSTTQITSTPEELNILDGVTSTAAELNILDGVTATAAELNILDGATVVVGEINALDLGSTAVGTAIASKAVILDSNKDYTGIRNFTITGEIDAATGDFSGDVDVDDTLEADAITVNGTALNTVIGNEATALAIALG